MAHTVVVGGGAAGFFAAVTAARANPSDEVILLEKTNVLLAKVRISGGGRCNVTHSCFDPKLLVKNYPRGEKALIGPFQPIPNLKILSNGSNREALHSKPKKTDASSPSPTTLKLSLIACLQKLL